MKMSESKKRWGRRSWLNKMGPDKMRKSKKEIGEKITSTPVLKLHRHHPESDMEFKERKRWRKG